MYIQIQSLIFPALAYLLLLWSISKLLFHKPGGNKNPPPSPPKLPILGNLHQLGSLPHRNLQIMAKKHGPLLLLHFGSVPALIVSSAEAAREVTKTHDLIFANRPLYKAHNKIMHGGKDVVFAPYGEYWRQMKSLFVLHLLSNKRIQSFRCIREEETALFLNKIKESLGEPVNLTRMFCEFTNDGICRSAFGKKYSDSESGKKFLSLVSELSEVFGAIGIGDHIPWLGWIDRVSGFDKKVDRVAKELDDFLEGVIQEIAQKKEKKGDNFVEIMLQFYDHNSTAHFSFNRESIKALLLDVFGAGTDTTSILLDWAMAELIRHPQVMEKLQKEVRKIIEDRENITDEDLEKMHYLKAVIKETLRLHPPAPLLVPRVASKDVKIKGYDISGGTIVIINAWAIGRDPGSWDELEMFYPERFLNSSIDFKGLDFEFIPFGAGRRGCPGTAFAMATAEFVLANLVHKFNWEEKELDMSESPGITVHRDVPLLAVASLSK